TCKKQIDCKKPLSQGGFFVGMQSTHEILQADRSRLLIILIFLPHLSEISFDNRAVAYNFAGICELLTLLLTIHSKDA
ncbi:MAG: hypothetical protein RIE59_14935, partial [Imperialibacter sp.]